MQKNTFRLFVSSTFSDFVGEREVLQTKVFPKVEKYASQKGASFQAIDLRWGVSAEAQVDQQTLDLCLREVKTCKSKPYPNFLILSGDRYGWVPLPFMIEKDEFESILKNINDKEEKNLLNTWYKLDENQIPLSYRLQERKDDYVKWEIWEKTEEKLRNILQTNIKKVLKENDKEYAKYFTSATETEVIEGILPYKDLTPFQKTLKEKNNIDEKVDAQNIFGFFRSIKNPIENSIFYTNKEDNKNAKDFQKELKKHIKEENQLIKDTKIKNDILDTSYLEEFAKKVENFLISRIDEHLKNQENQNLSNLEQEKQEQKLYKDIKLENFSGREDSLDKIKSYMEDKDINTPFIIYGKSGMGKSSLMAKAIEENKTKENIIYRFVGASSQSSEIRALLTSIFDELGIDIRSEKEKLFQAKEGSEEKIQLDNMIKEELGEDTNTDNFIKQFLKDKENLESYEDFCKRVQDEFAKLEGNITIFIDALDQLEEKRPLWLPRNLNKNIKIIISVLDDKNYEDTKVYESLEKSLDEKSFYEIPSFTNEVELLDTLLEKENRCITQKQKDYFLQQYKNTSTPFFIYVASYEMKNWTSYQEDYKLENTNKTIVKEYIQNLDKIYHHYKEFVQKSLCFILSSKYGLSENELLKLYNQDKNFIQKVAPEDYHKNLSQTLPLVHWSRFHTALSPFLKTSLKDRQEVFYFFHREFLDAIEDVYKSELEEEHRSLLRCIQSIIKDENISQKDFNSNRWGKLYAIALVEYKKFLNSKDYVNDDIDEFISFLVDLDGDDWIEKWLEYLNENGIYNQKHNYMYEAIAFGEVYYEVSSILYTQNPDRWAENYTLSLNNLAHSYYNIEKTDETINLEKEALDITKKLYVQNPDRWAENYTTSLNNLAFSYEDIGKIDEAINLEKEALDITKKLYVQNPDRWTKYYTTSLNNLASSYYNIGKTNEAINLQKGALDITKKLYFQNPPRWAENYTLSLNNLAISYKNIGKTNEAIDLEKESLDIIKELYSQNSHRWAEYYTTSLNNLAISYNNIGKINESIDLEEEALEIQKELYTKNPDRWAEYYTRSLNNLAISYNNIGKINETTDLLKKAYKISKNHLGEEHPNTQNFFNDYNYIKNESIGNDDT
ncbi:MAG: tetratricopeptide repeat protein, partial [Arcobacter sp.]|nr:tetratricopeptide repeat protein [Arcobacter sp.]